MTEQQRPVTTPADDDSSSPETAARMSVTKKRVAQAKESAFRISGVLETTVLGRLWSRLLEMEFVNRSVALAAKAFVSLFPAIIIVTAITPDSVRRGVLDNMSRRFGVSGSAFDVVKQAFATPAATRAASGFIGTVLTIAFAVSFTTALQRTYLRAWRRPPGGGAKNKFRGAAWIGGVAALIMLVTLIRTLLSQSRSSEL